MQTITIILPSGTERVIYPIRMLVQTQNAEFKAAHGMFLPGVGKQHPTLQALRDEFELPKSATRTWADMAKVMRAMYDEISEYIASVSQPA